MRLATNHVFQDGEKGILTHCPKSFFLASFVSCVSECSTHSSVLVLLVKSTLKPRPTLPQPSMRPRLSLVSFQGTNLTFEG